MSNLLEFIWSLSATLAALSCGVMAALIVARLIRQSRDRRLPALSVRLVLDLLAYSKGEIEAPKLAVRTRHERDLVLKSALDVARALDGASLERLVGLMRSVSLDVHCRRLAVRGHIPDRVAAIENLRLFRDAETASFLQQLQASPHFRICVAGMRTSIEVGRPPDLEAVLKLAERPEGARSLALFKIVEVCVHANLTPALAILAAGLPRESHVMTLKAIGTSRSPLALRAIARSTNDIDPEVRAAAITALRAIGAADIAPYFVAALRDVDWRVRLKAVEGLGQCGAPEDRASIEPLLNDSVWWIRFRAGEALERLARAEPSSGASALKTQDEGKSPLAAAPVEASPVAEDLAMLAPPGAGAKVRLDQVWQRLPRAANRLAS